MFMFCWLCGLSCETCSLSKERSEMLRQVESPKHLISTTTRHPSQHSTARQHCLHTGLTGLGWVKGKLHRTFLFFKLFKTDQ